MQVKIIDPSKDRRWDEFVQNHPNGTIFHTSTWARVIQKPYGYIPYYFILEDDDKKITAGLPSFLIKSQVTGNRLVSLPFTDECFFLYNSWQEVEEIISTVIKMVKEKRLDYAEIRTGPADFLNRFNFECHNYYRIFGLELNSGLDKLWKGFIQHHRRQIKKAEVSGIDVKESQSKEDILSFYQLNLLTRRKHGVIPQPYRFFQNIWQELITNGFASLLIARYKEKPIAGSLFLLYKDTIYFKFNASDSKYLKYRPNHLILWYTIQLAVQRGLKYLDLGRASPDNLGLMFFKRGWGAEEFDLPYYYWPKIKGMVATKESSLKYRLASSIFKRMPTPILKTMGNLFYKHLG